MDKPLKIRLSMPAVDKEDITAVTDTLQSGMLVQGPRAVEFEQKFASSVGVSYAVAVSSGTAALHCAVHALGIGPGDEVIVPSYTFVATANALLYAGVVPVFADIDPDTLCIDPDDIEKRITKRTKAIVVVHHSGLAFSSSRRISGPVKSKVFEIGL